MDGTGLIPGLSVAITIKVIARSDTGDTIIVVLSSDSSCMCEMAAGFEVMVFWCFVEASHVRFMTTGCFQFRLNLGCKPCLTIGAIVVGGSHFWPSFRSILIGCWSEGGRSLRRFTDEFGTINMKLRDAVR